GVRAGGRGDVGPAGGPRPAGPARGARSALTSAYSVEIRKPQLTSTLQASIATPASPSAGIRSAPVARARTGPLAFHATGIAASPSSAHGVAGTSASVATNGTRSSSTACRPRVLESPRRTARVTLPASVSEGMSRRLLVRLTAHETLPTATAATTPYQVIEPSWVNCVPSTATSPKNTNTATSPRPR